MSQRLPPKRRGRVLGSTRILLFATGYLLTACGEADGVSLIAVEQSSELGVDWETYREAALRVDAEGSVYYNVEGDLVFASEAGLREHFDSLHSEISKLVVYRRIMTGFEPTHPFPDSVDLVYCVSTDFGSIHAQVAGHVAAGAAFWERAANVRFRHDLAQDGACTVGTTTVDFAVKPAPPLTGSNCGYNKLLWPLADPQGSQGCFMGALVLDYSVPSPGGAPRPVVAAHELGHILGFRHEHPWTPGGCASEEAEAADLDSGGRQLTAYDPTSIMHYPASGAPGCGGPSSPNVTLSKLDGVGARSIYGMPVAWHASSIF